MYPLTVPRSTLLLQGPMRSGKTHTIAMLAIGLVNTTSQEHKMVIIADSNEQGVLRDYGFPFSHPNVIVVTPNDDTILRGQRIDTIGTVIIAADSVSDYTDSSMYTDEGINVQVYKEFSHLNKQFLKRLCDNRMHLPYVFMTTHDAANIKPSYA